MARICFFVIALLLVLQIVIVNRFSETGVEVAHLKVTAQQLQITNQLLKQQLAQLYSINRLFEIAKDYGFSPQKVAFEKGTPPLAGRLPAN